MMDSKDSESYDALSPVQLSMKHGFFLPPSRLRLSPSVLTMAAGSEPSAEQMLSLGPHGALCSCLHPLVLYGSSQLWFPESPGRPPIPLL